jgi:hypothetical protein
MSLAELMETPVYTVLTTVLEGSEDEYTLTCDAFIKFQMRRDGNASAGKDPFKKNIHKIVSRHPSIISCIGDLFEDSVKYISYTLWSSELYVLHKTELKVQ